MSTYADFDYGNLVRRMEDVEALSSDDKDKVYYLIDISTSCNKGNAIAVKP